MTTIASSGGFIPSSKDTPLDKRTRVNLYEEIQNIKNPYVGMEILVLADETNSGRKTRYRVESLKANDLGMENALIDMTTIKKVESYEVNLEELIHITKAKIDEFLLNPVLDAEGVAYERQLYQIDNLIPFDIEDEYIARIGTEEIVIKVEEVNNLEFIGYNKRIKLHLNLDNTGEYNENYACLEFVGITVDNSNDLYIYKSDTIYINEDAIPKCYPKEIKVREIIDRALENINSIEYVELETTDNTIIGAINELKEALANITIGDNGEAVNLPFNSIDKGLASSNIDFSEIKNGNYCYIIRGTIGYDIPDGNLPLNNDMVHITKSNIAMTIITLSGDIYTYNGGTNGTNYISCTKDNFMTYSVASETYQLKNDSKLITTDKTVVGAINELKNALDSVDGAFTILTVSPTYEELDTLPEGSKVYILNGLSIDGDPVHIYKSGNNITITTIDGTINKYIKSGNAWTSYSTEERATKSYVDTAIENAQLNGGEVDLSEYAKTEYVDTIIEGRAGSIKVNGQSYPCSGGVIALPTIPNATSQLTNDSNFVNETRLNEAIAGISSGGSGDCCIKRITIEEGNPTNINTLCASIRSKIGTDYQTGDILTGYANLITLNYGDTSKTDSGTLVVYIESYGHSIVYLYSQNDGAIYSGTLADLATWGDLVKIGEVDLSSYQTITDDTLTTTDKTIVGAINEVKTNVDSIEIPNVSNYQTKNDSTLTTTNKTIVGSINEIKANVDGITIPSAVSELTNDSGFITSDDIPTIPTKTSQLTNDSGFLDSTKVIVVNKGNANTLVDLDNDISVGKNAILLTGTVAQSSYDNELVYIDKRSSTSMYIYSMRGNKLFVMKSGSSWFQVENVNFIYPTDTISSLTTTAKTIPGAIDELRRGLNGIKVPTNVSELNNDSGYLTSHQDISGLQPKTDNSLTTTDKTVTGAINELKSGLDAVTASATSNLSIEQSYSVDETLTGGIWIDGKSIYRKVIDCGELPNGTEKSVPHGITNLDTIISINGVAISSENTIPLPYIHQTTTDIVQILCTPTEVKITTTSDKTAYTKSYVTVEYTKATDV